MKMTVDIQVLIQLLDIIQEISLCATQFRNNRCSGDSPIPAMVQQCANWEACMNRDPAVVGRAKVGAELIAEVINGFVEPISWKTLVRPTLLEVVEVRLTAGPLTDIHVNLLGFPNGLY